MEDSNYINNSKYKQYIDDTYFIFYYFEQPDQPYIRINDLTDSTKYEYIKYNDPEKYYIKFADLTVGYVQSTNPNCLYTTYTSDIKPRDINIFNGQRVYRTGFKEYLRTSDNKPGSQILEYIFFETYGGGLIHGWMYTQDITQDITQNISSIAPAPQPSAIPSTGAIEYKQTFNSNNLFIINGYDKARIEPKYNYKNYGDIDLVEGDTVTFVSKDDDTDIVTTDNKVFIKVTIDKYPNKPEDVYLSQVNNYENGITPPNYLTTTGLKSIDHVYYAYLKQQLENVKRIPTTSKSNLEDINDVTYNNFILFYEKSSQFYGIYKF